MAASSNITVPVIGATTTSNTPTTIQSVRSATPVLKAVEPHVNFQKVTKYLGDKSLRDDNVRFTYCNLSDYTGRPFGNYFSSIKFPITTTQRNQYKTLLANTALAPLVNTSKMILADIPSNQYGEMIDGKTISLRVPYKKGAAPSGHITCYSSFFNYNDDLNTQISDTNVISSLFGVEPTPDNRFNTNIAYLFTNDLVGSRPKDNITFVSKLADSQQINGGERGEFTVSMAKGGVFVTNLVFYMEAGYNVFFQTAVGEMPMSSAVTFGPNNAYFTLNYNVTKVIVENDVAAAPASINPAIDEAQAVTTKNWDRWSPVTKFPFSASGSGIPYASLNDSLYGVRIDEPVGIVYLDKGLIVITNPDIVANFDLTGAHETNPENQSAQSYSGGVAEFTNIFYPANPHAEIIFNSVVTEYDQNYSCIAYPDEFNSTTNPTFAQAYPSLAEREDKAVYITELGLYNKFGELIALCKTSRPIPKNRQSILSFTVRMKV